MLNCRWHCFWNALQAWILLWRSGVINATREDVGLSRTTLRCRRLRLTVTTRRDVNQRFKTWGWSPAGNSLVQRCLWLLWFFCFKNNRCISDLCFSWCVFAHTHTHTRWCLLESETLMTQGWGSWGSWGRGGAVGGSVWRNEYKHIFTISFQPVSSSPCAAADTRPSHGENVSCWIVNHHWGARRALPPAGTGLEVLAGTPTVCFLQVLAGGLKGVWKMGRWGAERFLLQLFCWCTDLNIWIEFVHKHPAGFLSAPRPQSEYTLTLTARSGRVSVGPRATNGNRWQMFT